MSTTPGPVVLIGIDAADAAVVEQLLAAGELPNIAALRRRGAWARLHNEPPGFLSLVWPSFFNGTRVDQHGWYYGKMWRAAHQRLEYADDTWLPQRPFWDDLNQAGARMALIDVPYSMGAPTSFNGIYLNGWQCHDDFGRQVYPASLWRELVGRFGKPSLEPEVFGPQTAGTSGRLRATMLASLEQTAAVLRVSAGSRALRPIRRGPGWRPPRWALSVGSVADRLARLAGKRAQRAAGCQS